LVLVALSDNPLTLIQEDSTDITIFPLEIDFSHIQKEICRGDEIFLNPSIVGVDYEWSDGSTDPFFTIIKGGVYSVTVTSGCDVAIETITVSENTLSVNLPPSVEIFLGDSLQLEPDIIGIPPFSYFWQSNSSEISCTNCRDIFIRPLLNSNYLLEVTDANGCTAMDSLFVTVNKDRDIYLPNVFSPNDDGFNDYFFAQSRRPKLIRNFQVFSRWGTLVFQANNLTTNDLISGWDGRFNGEKLNPDVFVYRLEVEFLDGEVLEFSGDVLLIK